MLEAAPAPSQISPSHHCPAPLQCMLFATPGNETKPKPNAGEKEKTKLTGMEGGKEEERKKKVFVQKKN